MHFPPFTLELFPVNDEARRFYEAAFPNHEKTATGILANVSADNAGIDLYLHKKTIVGKNPFATLLELGCKARMRDSDGNFVHYWLVPRSSIWKKNLIMANSIGVIDKGYRGQLMAPVYYNPNAGGESIVLNPGERYFQIVAPNMEHIHRVRILSDDQLDQTERGEGGFGSTGQ